MTRHGRATPLMWLTVDKSTLKGQRNDYEDQILNRLKEVLLEGVEVCLLADRGFGDIKLYELLKTLGFGYIIRFKSNIYVTDSHGQQAPASDWLPTRGRARKIINATVTGERYQVGCVIIAKDKGMKEAWCLACSDSSLSTCQAIAHYGRRFSTEENFRDVKDRRFGMGLSYTRVSRADRRDRMLLISALSVAFLTMLGAAGEAVGIDRHYKANTVKRRVHSFFRQGSMYFATLKSMKDEWLEPLIIEFKRLLSARSGLRRYLVSC